MAGDLRWSSAQNDDAHELGGRTRGWAMEEAGVYDGWEPENT
jgi:hypothetical protein